MNVNDVKSLAVRTAGRSGLILNKYSPEILMGLGIVGMIGTVILASKATLKVEDLQGDINSDLNKIHLAKTTIKKETYSDQDYKKDLVIAYSRGAMGYAKLYGPSVALGALSIACMLSAHGIMKRRNVAILAAYKILEESYMNYRGRVVEEHGKDVDFKYAHGVREVENKEAVVDENGKKTKKKTTSLELDGTRSSPYAVYFNETNVNWEDDPIMRAFFLQCQQDWANERLRATGHVFLNDVYRVLGFPDTKMGAVVGWVLQDFDGRDHGDGYIDFDMFNLYNQSGADFSKDGMKGVLLDFNVDGVILDMI